MPRSCQPTEPGRPSIAGERDQGVVATDLASRRGISLKPVCTAAAHARDRQAANGNRPRAIGLRVGARALGNFDVAFPMRGITNRTDALSDSMGAPGRILQPEETIVEWLVGTRRPSAQPAMRACTSAQRPSRTACGWAA